MIRDKFRQAAGACVTTRRRRSKGAPRMHVECPPRRASSHRGTENLAVVRACNAR